MHSRKHSPGPSRVYGPRALRSHKRAPLPRACTCLASTHSKAGPGAHSHLQKPCPSPHSVRLLPIATFPLRGFPPTQSARTHAAAPP